MPIADGIRLSGRGSISGLSIVLSWDAIPGPQFTIGQSAFVELSQYVNGYVPGITVITRISGTSSNGVIWNDSLDRIEYDGVGSAASLSGWRWSAQTPGLPVNSGFVTITVSAAAVFQWVITPNQIISVVQGGSVNLASSTYLTDTTGETPFSAIYIPGPGLPSGAVLAADGTLSADIATPIGDTFAHQVYGSAGVATGFQDFVTRRSQPGVVRWVGMEAPDLGTIDITSVNYPGPVKGCIQDIDGYSPVIDLTKSASADGSGSLKFSVPENTAGTMSGDWWVNFSDDASVLFDEGDEFFIQWRQWFDGNAIAYVGQVSPFPNNEGFKQCHIIAGDSPAIGNPSSCDLTEVVIQHFVNQPLPTMYHACGYFTPFESGISTPWNASNFNIQNSRTIPGENKYCTRYVGGSYVSRLDQNQTPYVGNCFGYFANEWMMFKVAITLGAWGQISGNIWGWINSRIRLWIGRQGQASEPVIDFIFSLKGTGGGEFGARRKYGKLWLDTYYQGAHTHPEYSIWYDEIIVSTDDIADPV